GIVGKDQLWEATGEHYELVDLGFGDCALIVAVPEASSLNGPETWPPTMRVATKYPRATQAYMERLGQAVEVVPLHGSVELAPLVGLVEAIVDLTGTGRPLRSGSGRGSARRWGWPRRGSGPSTRRSASPTSRARMGFGCWSARSSEPASTCPGAGPPTPPRC